MQLTSQIVFPERPEAVYSLYVDHVGPGPFAANSAPEPLLGGNAAPDP